jgi:hypothetical protein
VCGRHGELFGIRRLPAAAVLEPWPQGVAELVQLVEGGDAARAQGCELVVDLLQLGHQVVAAGVELDAALLGDALDLPQGLDGAVLLPFLAPRSGPEASDGVVDGHEVLDRPGCGQGWGTGPERGR